MGDSVLYVGSCSGLLIAYDSRSGDELWSLNLAVDGANQFHGDPHVRGRVIFVGTDAGTQNPAGYVYAVDRNSGEVLWERETPPGATSDIAGDDSCIFVATLGDEIHCLRQSDGSIKWTFQSQWSWTNETLYDLYADHFGLKSSPVLHEGKVYYAGRDSILYAISDRSGQVLWERKFPAEFSLAATTTASGLLVGTSDSMIHLLDFATGKSLATHSLGVTPVESPHVSGDAIHFLCGVSMGASVELVRYDLRTGSIVWRLSSERLGEDARFTVPRLHVHDGLIVVGTQSGVIAGISPADGQIVWRVQTVGAIRGIGSAGRSLFVGNLDGHLYVYRWP